MSEKYLQEFAEKIKPFRELWRSVRVTCLAAATGQAWLNLATRVSFSELLPARPTRVRPTRQLGVFVVDFPASELGYVLHSVIVDGFVPLDGIVSLPGDNPQKVHLTRAHAGLLDTTPAYVHWSPVVRYEKPQMLQGYGMNKPWIELSAWVEKLYELQISDLILEASSRLKLNEPAYDGIDDLLTTFLPGTTLRGQDQTVVKIVAPLPFEMDCTPDVRLVLKAPLAAFGRGGVSLRYFFRPQGSSKLETIELAGTTQEAITDMIRWDGEIQWPDGAERARIVLFFGEEEIDTIDVKRWSGAGTLRVAVDSFFDPEQKRLRNFLLGLDNKKDQNFEKGVVRLLGLLGVPVIWYGKGAVDGRPDIGAGLTEVDGKQLVILGECTREKPSEKLSALRERARELKEFLCEEADVLAIVFSPTEITSVEIEQASAYGIILAGRSEIQHLLSALQGRVSPGEIVSYLRTLPGLSTLRSPFLR